MGTTTKPTPAAALIDDTPDIGEAFTDVPRGTTEDAPPKRGPGRPPKNPDAPPAKEPSGAQRRAAADARRRNALAETFTMLGMAASMYNQADGMAIVSRAQPLADAWADLAKVNPSVAKQIDRIINGSAWSGVIMQTGLLALAIAQNHGLGIPAFLGATTTP